MFANYKSISRSHAQLKTQQPLTSASHSLSLIPNNNIRCCYFLTHFLYMLSSKSPLLPHTCMLFPPLNWHSWYMSRCVTRQRDGNFETVLLLVFCQSNFCLHICRCFGNCIRWRVFKVGNRWVLLCNRNNKLKGHYHFVESLIVKVAVQKTWYLLSLFFFIAIL